MGGIHRVRKNLKQSLALTDTKVMFNNCRILLANPNPSVAAEAAKHFPDFLARTTARARLVNVRDLYAEHLHILEKLEAGESLLDTVKEIERESN